MAAFFLRFANKTSTCPYHSSAIVGKIQPPMKPVCRLLARACSHLQICHNNNDKVINKNIGAYSYGPQRRPYPG